MCLKDPLGLPRSPRTEWEVSRRPPAKMSQSGPPDLRMTLARKPAAPHEISRAGSRAGRRRRVAARPPPRKRRQEPARPQHGGDGRAARRGRHARAPQATSARIAPLRTSSICITVPRLVIGSLAPTGAAAGRLEWLVEVLSNLALLRGRSGRAKSGSGPLRSRCRATNGVPEACRLRRQTISCKEL